MVISVNLSRMGLWRGGGNSGITAHTGTSGALMMCTPCPWAHCGDKRALREEAGVWLGQSQGFLIANKISIHIALIQMLI